MNYKELRDAIISDTHRDDLAAEVPRFVRQAEGLIRRDLRAYILSVVLTDADQESPGIYALPPYLLNIREVSLVGCDGDSLDKVAPGQIRRLPVTYPPTQYAQLGNGRIELRGHPAEGAEFDLLYYGTPPPLVNDEDTNDLLRDHETLYMAGSMFFLYQHTQDRELSSDQVDLFNGVLEPLNQQMKRQLSGASIASAYDFGNGGSY